GRTGPLPRPEPNQRVGTLGPRHSRRTPRRRQPLGAGGCAGARQPTATRLSAPVRGELPLAGYDRTAPPDVVRHLSARRKCDEVPGVRASLETSACPLPGFTRGSRGRSLGPSYLPRRQEDVCRVRGRGGWSVARSEGGI